jgi:hypothetical protein
MRAQWWVGALVMALATSASAKAKPKGASPVPVAPAAPVRPFDDLLAEAEPVTDLAKLVDPLFDTCDRADALAHTQCEGEREFLEREARSKTFVAVGDAASVSVGPYDATAHEVDVDIDGCLACIEPLLLEDGHGGHVKRYVATRAPRVNGTHAGGVDIETIELPIATPELAQKWKKTEKRVVPRLRTQFIFTLGPTWSTAESSGVTIVPLAYRVLDVCSGEVLTTVPAAPRKKVEGPIERAPGDRLRCPGPDDDLTPDERAERARLGTMPEQLTRELIAKTLASVQPKIHDCHMQLDESGAVNLRFTIEGATGRISDIDVEPPFDRTPGGACVKAAMKSARFYRFKNEKQEIRVPVILR